MNETAIAEKLEQETSVCINGEDLFWIKIGYLKLGITKSSGTSLQKIGEGEEYHFWPIINFFIFLLIILIA